MPRVVRVKVKVVVRAVLARVKVKVAVPKVVDNKVAVAVLAAPVVVVVLPCWDCAKMHPCKKKSIWLTSKKLI
jgi:hypothetical protein